MVLYQNDKNLMIINESEATLLILNLKRMNQIYLKTKYLFLLLGFIVSSAGMAQSPFQSTNKSNASQRYKHRLEIQQKNKFLRKPMIQI